MAKSVSVLLESDYSQILSNFKFPVILKPEISAKGDKQDIAICQNINEAQDAISVLKEKGYDSIFAQEHLKVDFEIVLVGFVNKDKVLFIANRVLRQWPNLSGSNSFSHIITDEKILAKCKTLFSTVANYGYNGLIDVECFWVNDDLYLNEINWRNSGGDFRAVNDGFYYAYWFYRSVCSANYEIPSWKAPSNSYSMVGIPDFRHVLKRNISLKEWFKDVCKTRNFSVIRKDDIMPFLYKNTIYQLGAR
jgi:predicted ATP-grasp superfamily ATP-dependent carboligase